MLNHEELDVIIIGAGLAGLACGVQLAQAGRRPTILEAGDRIGGRVQSDHVDGFTLDRGFQVLQTAYPACRQLLDYDQLRLHRFEPGALIRHRGRFTTLSDPWRRPGKAIATALNPVGTFADKLRIWKVRRAARSGSLSELFHRDNQTTAKYLRSAGFSATIIDQFFRPFLGGVFLDESLSVSSRMFEFVFRMFATGDVAIPADGMAAIPRQLAERLPQGTIRFQQTVTQLSGNQVQLRNGQALRGHQIVVATDSSIAANLLGSNKIDTEWNEATTLYYAASELPDRRRMLMLRGDETGPVQTAVVLSNVAPQYAPRNQSLISVNLGPTDDTLDRNDLDAVDRAVRRQLHDWFPSSVSDWRRLAVYHIPHGVPKRTLNPVLRSIDASDYDGPAGVLVCGDHCETPSIQGAMNSGIRVAAAILDKPSPASRD